MGSYRHLTRDDRDQIAGMLAAGLEQKQIAEALGKSKSTISRELRRNALDSGGYSAAIADGAYMERRQRQALCAGHPLRLKACPELFASVAPLARLC